MTCDPRSAKPHMRHLRVRVENCVNTILDLNSRLGDGFIRPDVIRHFERLRESLRLVTDDNVNEADIFRIEEATNLLLAELRKALSQAKVSTPAVRSMN